MNAIQGALITGVGGLVGIAIGWALFNAGATPDPNCVLPEGADCRQMWSMGFLGFVSAWAAFCGLIGLLIQVGRGK